MGIHVLEWMLFKKESVLSLKKIKKYWFSYFQIVLNDLKSTMSVCDYEVQMDM